VSRKTKTIVSLLGIVGLAVLLVLASEMGRRPDSTAPTTIAPSATAISPTAAPEVTPSPSPSPTATALPPTATLETTPSPTAGTLPSPSPSASPTPETAQPEPVYTFRVVHTYPHDRGAYTQGLVYHQGFLYEGTGLNGRSSLRRVDLESGEVLQFRSLDQAYFGEGIAIYQDRLYQLTWKSQLGFIYDWQTFEPLGTWDYDGEGWGLTHDGTHLIMSDGTSVLRFLDPDTLQVVRQVEVNAQSGPVVRLNELEYVQGEVYANIWQTNLIARIDPQSGAVVGWIDLSGLLPAEDWAGADVLNGIAYDAASSRLFVTGKLWPKLFEIELVPE
jgi:glutamine cyclotransferase